MADKIFGAIEPRSDRSAILSALASERLGWMRVVRGHQRIVISK